MAVGVGRCSSQRLVVLRWSLQKGLEKQVTSVSMLSACYVMSFAAVGGVQTCMLFGKLKCFYWILADVVHYGF